MGLPWAYAAEVDMAMSLKLSNGQFEALAELVDRDRDKVRSWVADGDRKAILRAIDEHRRGA
jgi:3-methyladenine DNA glycosylase AlkD